MGAGLGPVGAAGGWARGRGGLIPPALSPAAPSGCGPRGLPRLPAPPGSGLEMAGKGCFPPSEGISARLGADPGSRVWAPV